MHYIEESVPVEWYGNSMGDVDYRSWLDHKLKEGKVFCGWITSPGAAYTGAVFLVGLVDPQ